MEQKYIIDKDLDAGTLTIKEIAETDVSKFTTLHQETFALDAVEAASAKGKENLVALFRSNNFFPPEFPANTMAEGIISMLGDTEKPTLKIALNDNDSLENHREEALEALANEEKAAVEIDTLLEDDDVDDDVDKDLDVV